MDYRQIVNCLAELDGATVNVEAEVVQQYTGMTAEISLSFDWPSLITGYPRIRACDSGATASLNSSVELVVTAFSDDFGQGTTKVTCTAPRLDIRNAALPGPKDLVDVCIYLANFPTFFRITPFQIVANGLTIDFQLLDDKRIDRVAVVTGVQFDQVELVKDVVRDVAWLASLAAGCYVTAPRIDVIIGGKSVATQLRSTDISISDVGKHLVHDKMSPTVLKSFIEHSIGPFQSVATDYRVPNLIHVGLLAKHNAYIQVKALLMADFLEILRFNYASNVGVRAGILRVSGIDLFWTPASTYSGRATFEEILQQFCTDNQISGWQSDFKDLRNEIIHTGDFSGPQKYARYQKLHHFCDRVLLALLNWNAASGTYIPFDNPAILSPTVTSVNRIAFAR